MIWRGIVIIFVHFTVVMLMLSGFTWLDVGYGLNPLISWPAGVMLFILNWLWIAHEAYNANVKVEDYLEYLDERECAIRAYVEQTGGCADNLAGILQIHLSRDFWTSETD